MNRVISEAPETSIKPEGFNLGRGKFDATEGDKSLWTLRRSTRSKTGDSFPEQETLYLRGRGGSVGNMANATEAYGAMTGFTDAKGTAAAGIDTHNAVDHHQRSRPDAWA